MTDQVQILVAFILYIGLFAWIGARRGTKREMIVLLTALASYFGLQQFQDLAVKLANLGSRFLAFARAGGLENSSPENMALLREGPALVQPGQEQTFLFLVWATILVLVYIASEKLVSGSGSQSRLVAGLVGMANGFFYITVILPRLMALMAPSGQVSDELIRSNSVQQVTGDTLDVLSSSFRSLWSTVEPQQSWIFLFILSALLIAAASTLRNTKRA